MLARTQVSVVFAVASFIVIVVAACALPQGVHAQASLSFFASPDRVTQTPATVTLSWQAQRVSRCAAAGGWSGKKAAVGSEEVTINNTEDFTLVCTTSGSPISKSITVSVGEPTRTDRSGPPQPPQRVRVEERGASSVVIAWDAPGMGSVDGYKVYRDGEHVASIAATRYEDVGLQPEMTYRYVVRTLGNATESANTDVVVVTTRPGELPAIAFSATPSVINLEDTPLLTRASTTLSWSAAHAVSCTAGGGWSGARSAQGQEVVTLDDTTIFIITCVGESGSKSESVTVSFVGSENVTRACSLIQSGDDVPRGFGAPYNVLSQAGELLIEVSCTQRRAVVTVGNGSRQQMIYTTGYEFRGDVWQPLSFAGPRREGAWLVGAGKAELARSPTEMGSNNFVVAYICTWTSGAWQCGCRDSACTQGNWQMQAFRR